MDRDGLAGRLRTIRQDCEELVAGLIDAGYRGEMECIIAKIFGSEAQKEAAIELFMKTHGGRSFLHGHIFGDHVHEYLIRNKRDEWGRFKSYVTPYELERYLPIL